MHGGYFSYALLAALATALLVAALTDIRRREIDNWLTIGIALAAPLFWWASAMSWSEIGYQLAIAAGTFAVLCVLFATGQMGGGDVKLLTALALWIEPFWFLRLLFVMAVAGGVLTLGLLAWHHARRRGGKLAVPYGVAISFAGLWVLASQYFPALVQGARFG